MKTPKLIKKVRKYLDADSHKLRKEEKCIKELLKKLKKKERVLEARLEKEKDAKKRRQLRKNLQVIYAQRKKGVSILKTLKKK